MIDWGTIKQQIEQTVAELTDLSPSQVQWRDEAKGGAWNNMPVIFLRIRSIEDVGFQEERRTQPTATDNAVVNVVQQKSFVLSLRCESFEQNIESPKHAGTLVSTLRTRLRRSSSIFDRGVYFAIWDYGKANWVDYVNTAGRQVSCYVLDLRCATVDNDLDTTPNAGGWIGEAQVAGTVTDGANPIPVTQDVKT